MARSRARSLVAADSRLASEFERRAARAELLIAQAPSAEDPLRFAAGLHHVFANIAAGLETAHARDPFTGCLEKDAERLLDLISPVFRFAAASGPEELAREGRARQSDDPPTARSRLLTFWAGDRSSAEDYLTRASLRPYVEFLRTANVAPERLHRRGHCPFCGGGAWISARREGSLTEGARRMLGCALCGGEWLFGRILCPSCFEEDPHKLPSFQDEKYPTVRIEGCETCRRYVKSIDLSEDARPIPEIDDLVSIAMDLWAIEQGFTRVEPGLAGL